MRKRNLRGAYGIHPSRRLDAKKNTIITEHIGTSIMSMKTAKFGIGQIVQHRKHPFRGVIFDVDPIFDNSDEWWDSIPEGSRPAKDQPYYHLFAENSETSYIAYVSEQNLLPDESGKPVSHPQIRDFFFKDIEDGHYTVRHNQAN